MIRALLARVARASVPAFFVASNAYMLTYIGSSLSVMCGGADWHANAITAVVEFFANEEPMQSGEAQLVAVR